MQMILFTMSAFLDTPNSLMDSCSLENVTQVHCVLTGSL